MRFIEHSGLGRLFRTGDIVVAVEGGGWRLAGRRDGQVSLYPDLNTTLSLTRPQSGR